MSEKKPTGPQDKEITIRSEKFDEFLGDVSALYIPGNQSARIHFLQKWPDGAAYIFPVELMQSDADGGMDKDARGELEERAEEERLRLLDILENLEGRSLDDRGLNVEPVKALVEALGRDLSLCIYHESIVNQFISAPSVAEVAPVAAVDIVTPVAQKAIAISSQKNAPKLSGLKMYKQPEKTGVSYHDLLEGEADA